MAWLIRAYDATGRLLFIASTTKSADQRIRGLRSEMPWWGLVETTLIDPPGPDGLAVSLRKAIAAERPRFYRDSAGKQPYLRARPRGSDRARRLLATDPLSRISARRGAG